MRRGAAALACAVLIAAATALAADSRERIANPDYVGKGVFDREMKVELRIDPNPGRDRVTFQVRRLKRFCNKNVIEERVTPPPIRARLEKNGREFERVIYEISGDTESVFWLKGRLIEGGSKAKGFVINTHNPDEPSGDDVECTTFGKRSWIAKRVD